jgi:hypothetical protein
MKSYDNNYEIIRLSRNGYLDNEKQEAFTQFNYFSIVKDPPGMFFKEIAEGLK